VAIVVSTNNSSAPLDRTADKTTLQALMKGDEPVTLGKGLKAAYVYIDFNATTYASGGLTVGALAALPGWSAVLGAVPTFFIDGSTALVAYYDAANDKVYVTTAVDGAQHAASATSGVAKMLFLGY